MNQTRRKLLIAVGIFWSIAILAVVINSKIGQETARPWLAGNSISWYVGSRTWSALLFAVGNCFVAAIMGRFLFLLGENWRLPRAYFFFLILLVVALIWLSVFPIGYFDSPGEKSIISYLHAAGSRIMFFAMAAVMFFLARKGGGSASLRLAMEAFAVYAIFCVIFALVNLDAFYSIVLFIEGFYILGFMLLLLWCGKETEQTKQNS